jgi:membrane protein implicated in regulation of membrane protease activity
VIRLAKLLMIAGGALLLVGALLFLGQRLGVGRLPGDFSWQGKNFSFQFPLATSLLVSVVLTLLINLWLGRSR